MSRLITFIALGILFIANTSFNESVYSKSSYYIVVDKTKYELHVYDAEGWLITYPVVFGNNDLGDKLVQGDRKTPEGTYTIINKRVHNKWCRFLSLDYPTEADVEKFNQRVEKGIIPPYAKLGSAIGIHGTWPHEDYAIDRFQNWTEGCISLKNEHVKELFTYIPVGTRITIRH